MSQIAERINSGDSAVLNETVGALMLTSDPVIHIEKEDLLALLSLAGRLAGKSPLGLIPDQKETLSVTHLCPAAGEALTPCCGKWPNALPMRDRITKEWQLVTCPSAVRPDLPSSAKPSKKGSRF